MNLYRATCRNTSFRLRDPELLGTPGLASYRLSRSEVGYEYDPPGPSKKVRTAVGRQICAAGSAGGASKASA